ncbi:uncharacterized protein J8A68_001565 [[Candida] subhashii]|uniref:Uncharacterized protein n=1 Tax=[Candida] subhashii TaxID=561895 RepID=A0A8J5QTW1_9ASCO|nr:uncharacterized protein J8A68_001565 [[Candida] subhashii]KAG7664927.1 hypothetical protein J8A68_001565 [[Candida] subhashii]
MAADSDIFTHTEKVYLDARFVVPRNLILRVNNVSSSGVGRIFVIWISIVGLNFWQKENAAIDAVHRLNILPITSTASVNFVAAMSGSARHLPCLYDMSETTLSLLKLWNNYHSEHMIAHFRSDNAAEMPSTRELLSLGIRRDTIGTYTPALNGTADIFCFE